MSIRKVRSYSIYEDYIKHQAQKHDLIDLKDYSKKFYDVLFNRIKDNYKQEIPNNFSSCLCIGARNGIEVKAFIDNGYFAVGVDLNPGKNNPYVLQNDMYKLPYLDNSIDVIYTNILDHAMDFDKFLLELKRMGKIVITEIPHGDKEGGLIPKEYEVVWWDYYNDVIKQFESLGFIKRKEIQFTIPWNGVGVIWSK